MPARVSHDRLDESAGRLCTISGDILGGRVLMPYLSDLGRLYRLYKDVPNGLDKIAEQLTKFAQGMGEQIVNNSKEQAAG